MLLPVGRTSILRTMISIMTDALAYVLIIITLTQSECSGMSPLTEFHVARGWRLQWSSNNGYYNSLADCILDCLRKTPGCSAVHYEEESMVCTWKDTETTIIIGSPGTYVTAINSNIKAVYACNALGVNTYAYSFAEASGVCTGLHGHLMSHAELQNTSNLWSSMCWCAWLADGYSYYLERGNVYDLCTGTQGIHACSESQAHAWCTVDW